MFIKNIRTRLNRVWIVTFLFCGLKLVRFYFRKKYKIIAPSAKDLLPLTFFLV